MFAKIHTGPGQITKFNTCCDQIADAFLSGTDNEAYGSLMNLYSGVVEIGSSELPSLKFCPWCGKKIDIDEWKKP